MEGLYVRGTDILCGEEKVANRCDWENEISC